LTSATSPHHRSSPSSITASQPASSHHRSSAKIKLETALEFMASAGGVGGGAAVRNRDGSGEWIRSKENGKKRTKKKNRKKKEKEI